MESSNGNLPNNTDHFRAMTSTDAISLSIDKRKIEPHMSEQLSAESRNLLHRMTQTKSMESSNGNLPNKTDHFRAMTSVDAISHTTDKRKIEPHMQKHMSAESGNLLHILDIRDPEIKQTHSATFNIILTSYE
jgi:hypothetical protein